MAAPSYTYSLTNGTTADASQVMQDFNDILNGVTDGTKDLSISALTLAGTFTANGHVNLGNSSSDDLSITASLASSIAIKTTNTYNIGSSTLGLASIYFGANSQTVRILPSSTMSATWTLTLPVTAGTASYFLMTNGSGVSSWSQIVNASVDNSAAIAGSKLAAATSSLTGTISGEEVGTFTAAFTGARTVSPTWTYARSGRVVTLSWGDSGAGASSAGIYTSDACIPSTCRTGRAIYFPVFVMDNSVLQSVVGTGVINTNGTITIQKTFSSSNFSATNNSAFYAGTVTYTTN